MTYKSVIIYGKFKPINNPLQYTLSIENTIFAPVFWRPSATREAVAMIAKNNATPTSNGVSK